MKVDHANRVTSLDVRPGPASAARRCVSMTIALVLAGGCGDDGPGPSDAGGVRDATSADAQSADAPSADASVADGSLGDAGTGGDAETDGGLGEGDAGPCTAPGAWGPAVLLAEVSSTADDRAPHLTADGLGLYFESDRAGGDGPGIWLAIRASVAEPFETPVPLTELTASDDTGDPTLAGDELEIVFARDGAMRCLFSALRADRASPFGAPVRFDALCEDAPADGPFLSPDSLTLLYASSGAMYITSRASRAAAFGAVAVIAELDGASLSSDGLTVYFASDRAGGVGGLDLYEATRPDRSSPFGAPVMISELASISDDDDPALSSDGLTLYFSSDRDGDRDLYAARRACVR
jgi:hypothetical protein